MGPRDLLVLISSELSRRGKKLWQRSMLGARLTLKRSEDKRKDDVQLKEMVDDRQNWPRS